MLPSILLFIGGTILIVVSVGHLGTPAHRPGARPRAVRGKRLSTVAVRGPGGLLCPVCGGSVFDKRWGHLLSGARLECRACRTYFRAG